MMDSITLKPGESIESLQFEGLRIIQSRSGFRYGTDAVLLGDFALIKPRARCADLGTGTGIIALLVAAHHKEARLDAVELDQEAADMARRSVDMNGMSERVRVHNADMRLAAEILGYGQMDQVLCNPPYFEEGSALLPECESKRIARTDVDIGIKEIARVAFQLLKSGGRFSVVFPAARMDSLINALCEARLAPKRVRTVHHTFFHAPKLVLMDAVKHGGTQLHWMPPLILRNPDGTPTQEWHRIYGCEKPASFTMAT